MVREQGESEISPGLAGVCFCRLRADSRGPVAQFVEDLNTVSTQPPDSLFLKHRGPERRCFLIPEGLAVCAVRKFRQFCNSVRISIYIAGLGRIPEVSVL